MKGLLQKLYPSKLRLTGKSLLKPSSALGLVSSFIALKFLEARESPVTGLERNVDFNSKLLGDEFESEFQKIDDESGPNATSKQTTLSNSTEKVNLSVNTFDALPQKAQIASPTLGPLGTESDHYTSFFTGNIPNSESTDNSDKVRGKGFIADLSEPDRFAVIDSFVDSLSENLKALIEQVMQNNANLRSMEAEVTVNDANPVNVAYVRIEPTEVGPLMMNIQMDLDRISENQKSIESTDDSFILGVDVSIGISSVAAASAKGLEVIAHPASNIIS